MNTILQKIPENEKLGKSLLGSLEQKIIKSLTPRLPQFLNGYNLTLFTLLWSLLVIIFSFLATKNIHWLWAVSLVITLQWFTDSFDGAIGRYRNSGLIKWGFHMDHFLDYVFLCAILIGYSFIVDDHFKYLLFFILAIFGAFMVNAYLGFGASQELKVSYLKFGPTEVRIIFIAVNSLISLLGKTYMGQALPYVLIFSLCVLSVVVYRTQKYMYTLDMKNKGKNKK